jgi:hypothetical protein
MCGDTQPLGVESTWATKKEEAKKKIGGCFGYLVEALAKTPKRRDDARLDPRVCMAGCGFIYTRADEPFSIFACVLRVRRLGRSGRGSAPDAQGKRLPLGGRRAKERRGVVSCGTNGLLLGGGRCDGIPRAAQYPIRGLGVASYVMRCWRGSWPGCVLENRFGLPRIDEKHD